MCGKDDLKIKKGKGGKGGKDEGAGKDKGGKGGKGGKDKEGKKVVRKKAGPEDSQLLTALNPRPRKRVLGQDARLQSVTYLNDDAYKVKATKSGGDEQADSDDSAPVCRCKRHTCMHAL